VVLQRHTGVSKVRASRRTLERSTRDGESPVGESADPPARILSTTGHEKPGGKQGRPRSKAKYSCRPIVNQYREGKVKRTPVRGVKENLKPSVYKRSEHNPAKEVRRRAFWRMNQRVTLGCEVKAETAVAAGKPSLKRASSSQE
jgi:hypothetical protein